MSVCKAVIMNSHMILQIVQRVEGSNLSKGETVWEGVRQRESPSNHKCNASWTSLFCLFVYILFLFCLLFLTYYFFWTGRGQLGIITFIHFLFSPVWQKFCLKKLILHKSFQEIWKLFSKTFTVTIKDSNILQKQISYKFLIARYRLERDSMKNVYLLLSFSI